MKQLMEPTFFLMNQDLLTNDLASSSTTTREQTFRRCAK
jgi:hypothetical protein